MGPASDYVTFKIYTRGGGHNWENGLKFLSGGLRQKMGLNFYLADSARITPYGGLRQTLADLKSPLKFGGFLPVCHERLNDPPESASKIFIQLSGLSQCFQIRQSPLTGGL